MFIRSSGISSSMNSIFTTIFDSNKTEYFDQSFTKLNCGSKTIQHKVFENCNFKHCDFDNSTLLNCKFVDCEFTQCTLNSITPTNTLFSGVVFERSKLLGINWATAKWPQIVLSSLINFYSCNISHSSFFGLQLSAINLQECKAHDVDFREADLSSSNLTNTDFHQSLFMRTKLTAANFSEAINYNIDLTLNDAKKAIFTFPDVINLLYHFGIQINGLPNFEGETEC